MPLAFSKCESEHRYKNFDMAAYTLRHPGHAGLQTPEWDVSKVMGYSFDDTDVYKTIEGASYILQTYPDKKLKAYIDSVLTIVGAAQEPDGYLYTARTINPAHPHQWSGNKRWSKEEDLCHELYNLGHMVDAACAHYQATGSHKFIDIAHCYADDVKRVQKKIIKEWNAMTDKGITQGELSRVSRFLRLKMAQDDRNAELWAECLATQYVSGRPVLTPRVFSSAVAGLDDVDALLRKYRVQGTSMSVVFHP